MLYSTFLWNVSKFLTDYNKAPLSIISAPEFTKAVQSSESQNKDETGTFQPFFPLGP